MEQNKIIININKSHIGQQNMSEFCDKVITDSTIVMNVINSNVRYKKSNGFHLYDLVYLCHRQYLFTTTVPQFENYENRVVNEEDIDWNNKDVDYDVAMKDFLSLSHFEYYPETKTVICVTDH